MGLDQFLETLSSEGQEYYTNVVGDLSMRSPECNQMVTNVCSSGKSSPDLLTDSWVSNTSVHRTEHISIHLIASQAETNMYWCNFAMVREDYQGKGILRAMFEHVFPKVRLSWW